MLEHICINPEEKRNTNYVECENGNLLRVTMFGCVCRQMEA